MFAFICKVLHFIRKTDINKDRRAKTMKRKTIMAAGSIALFLLFATLFASGARPHRSAMSPMAALQELKRCCPSGYDTDCDEALAELVHLPKLEKAFACT